MNEHTFSTAFSRVKELAEDFAESEQSYLEAKYSEAQARLDFIDKFWIALGWDVNHERERNPYCQEWYPPEDWYLMGLIFFIINLPVYLIQNNTGKWRTAKD